MAEIPNFANVELDDEHGPDNGAAGSVDEWQAAVEGETGKAIDALVWDTPEGIGVKPLYTASDLEGLDFLETYPGIAPFLRGPYPTM